MLDEAQRRQMLASMGIDVYLLRASAAPVAQPDAGDVDLVVACAPADPYSGRLRNALPVALGLGAARIRWIEADPAGSLATPPPARAYLALGTDLPRALGEHLSTMQQLSSVIAVADVPQACLRDGLAKRALWEALKPIARHLRPLAS